MGNFELNTSASKYTWTGTVVPDVKKSTKYGEVLYLKPSPSGEGLGAADVHTIARRMCELSVEHGKGVDPFTVWLDGPFTPPEGAVLKKGEKSLYHEGPITGAVLTALVGQADSISLVKSKKYSKPTLKLTKNGGAAKKKEEVKPKLSW